MDPHARTPVPAHAIAALIALASCAAPQPPRTSFARYAGAPSARDPAASDPEAIAIADRVFAAAGGTHWDAAREVRWTQTQVDQAAEPAATTPDDLDARRPPAERWRFVVEVTPAATGSPKDHRWDRWNGRYAVSAHHGELDTAVVIDLYRGEARLVAHAGSSAPVRGEMIAEGSGGARATWNVDTALLCLPFLLAEPGVQLARLAPVFGEAGEVQRLGVAFDDPLRAGTAFELELAGDVIARVVVRSPASPGPVVYALGDRAIAGGLAIPTSWTELASGRRTRITELAVLSAVDDHDFARP